MTRYYSHVHITLTYGLVFYFITKKYRDTTDCENFKENCLMSSVSNKSDVSLVCYTVEHNLPVRQNLLWHSSSKYRLGAMKLIGFCHQVHKVSIVVTNIWTCTHSTMHCEFKKNSGETPGCHGDKHEYHCRLGWGDVQSSRNLALFRRCLLPPSSERSISLMMQTVSMSFLCSGFLPIVLILSLQSGQMLFQATTLN